MIDECTEEKIAQVQFGCNVSREEAEQIYAQQLKEEQTTSYWADRVMQIKVSKKSRVGGKLLSGGE